MHFVISHGHFPMFPMISNPKLTCIKSQKPRNSRFCLLIYCSMPFDDIAINSRDLSCNLNVPALCCAPGSAESRYARAGYE
jgi:hypothetical protein